MLRAWCVCECDIHSLGKNVSPVPAGPPSEPALNLQPGLQATRGKSLGRHEPTAMATAIRKPEDKTCFILLFCTKGSRDTGDKLAIES